MKLYKKRHQVAHFMIVMHAEKQPFYPTIRPFFTMDAFKRQAGMELTTAQIEERARSFQDLAERIRRHVQHVGTALKLPLEYFVQAGDLAHPPLTKADLPPAASQPPPQS